MADAESSLVQELRALAGVTKEDTFDVSHEGVLVGVSYSGGSSSSLTLKVRYDVVARAAAGGAYRGNPLTAIRPMRIALRPEGSTERQGKAVGMDVEVQTNDPAFDDGVYIDTPTPANVTVQVLGPEVRRAVLDLFALDFVSITIDDVQGDVVARIVSFASLKPPESPGKRAIDAFSRLARGLPPVGKLEGQHAAHPLGRPTAFFIAIALVACFGGVPVYFIGNPTCVDDMPFAQFARCLGPGLFGGVIGLLCAIVSGLLAARYTRRYRGRSDSSREGSSFAFGAGIATFWVVAITIAFAIVFLYS